MEYLSEPKNVRAIIEKAKNFMADAVEFIGTAAYNIINALDYVAFGQIPNDFIESIKSGTESMGAQIRAMGPGGANAESAPVGGNAAAGAVAATTPAKGGFADPNKYSNKGEGTTIYNNIQVVQSDDSVLAKANRAVTIDKNQINTK
jgi:hypothetical protein